MPERNRAGTDAEAVLHYSWGLASLNQEATSARGYPKSGKDQ